MRRQRFAYTIPSQDGSFFPDSDSMSILSSHYSYPETSWPQIISPESDSLIPYYIYPYPLYQTLAEPISCIPGFYDPSLAHDAFNTFKDSYVNNEGLTYYTISPESFCNSPLGDGIFTEDLASCVDAPVNEIVNDIQYEEPKVFPRITNYGAVTILLRHLVRVDISPAKAVYVTNSPASCIAAVNGAGDKSCIFHPNGRVHHIGQDIHMLTLNRRAKICKRGIIFSSAEHCLSYLVDDSGTKTSSEKLRNLNHDFSLRVFYSNGMIENNFEECNKLVNETKYKNYKNGDEVWVIGGVRIKQDQMGDVKITRERDHYTIKTSPTTGEVSIKTNSAEMSIGRYPDKYFLVRKGDKQVSGSLKCFNVQNGSQKAGFNSSGKVVLF